MGTGGTIVHGVVVAREYGTLAVVGAPYTTGCISTRGQINAEGSAGIITFEKKSPTKRSYGKALFAWLFPVERPAPTGPYRAGPC